MDGPLQMVCGVESCRKDVATGGYCNSHYLRNRRHGNPLGGGAFRVRDGKQQHPLFNTWAMMMSRCRDAYAENYEYYGGRGIRVEERWHDFWKFAEDVCERPEGCTLDRIDNDGHYGPENFRWAPRSVQMKNTRMRRDNKSGHRGVTWDNSRKRWRVYTGGGKTREELGYYTSLEEAAKVRHAAIASDPHARCCDDYARSRQPGTLTARVVLPFVDPAVDCWPGDTGHVTYPRFSVPIHGHRLDD